MNDNDFLAECEVKANEAKGIAAKATKGPWWRSVEPGVVRAAAPGDPASCGLVDIGDSMLYQNAEFIAHARTSNPDLADRVLQLVAMVRKLQEQVDDMEDRAREEAYYRDLERD